MISKPNLLIIGSTGRNTGKTEFICSVIEANAGQNNIVGIKIIPVDLNEEKCHRGTEGCGLCDSLTGDYEIIEETAADTRKDTSRMLHAGAVKAYLLVVRRSLLKKGMEALFRIIQEDTWIIAESNSIRKVVEPGLFIVVKRTGDASVKKSCSEVICLADRIVTFDDRKWDFRPERVALKNVGWVLTEEPDTPCVTGQNG